MSPRILVPVEPQGAPDGRVELVGSLAGPIHADVELLVVLPFPVVDPHTTLTPDSDPHAEAEQARITRAAWAETIQEWADEGMQTEVRVCTGHAAKEILDRARTVRAAYIVMATHGRSGLARAVMGSVTEAVLRRATCPVLVLPNGRAVAA